MNRMILVFEFLSFLESWREARRNMRKLEKEKENTEYIKRNRNHRDSEAVIRSTLMIGAGKGAALGLVVGLLLFLLSPWLTDSWISPARSLVFSALWCSVAGYLFTLTKMLIKVRTHKDPAE